MRVTSGAYLPAADPYDLHDRCAALLFTVPRCVVSHWTAVAVHGLPLPPGRPAEPFHLLVPPGTRAPRRDGVVSHTSDRRITPVRIASVPVTDLVRTWCDLARDGATVAELVVVGDAIQRRHALADRLLHQAVAAGTGRRGVATARRAVGLLDGRAESPMESLVRVAVVLAGLEPPVPQLVVRDGAGRFLARVDLGWPEQRLIVEYDGSHHLDRGQCVSDLRRRERLELAGWTVVVLTAEDVLGNPVGMVARIAARLH